MNPIRIQISPGFLLWVAWLNYLDDRSIVPQALLACFLHECGHLAAIRLQNGRIRSLCLTAAGARMELDARFGYRQELLAALAGPLVNILLSAFLARYPQGYLFAGLNLALACLNLLPVGPLDGGRILRCALCLLLPESYAQTACHWVSIFFTFILSAAGLMLACCAGNFTLAMVALWLLTHFPTERTDFPLVLSLRKR